MNRLTRIFGRDLAKTLSYLVLHLIVGFSVAYLFTGSIAIAGGIALVEPLANAVVFFFHEKLWRRVALPGLKRPAKAQPAAA